ncbi:HIRAN domain-containing protein [Croceicoccus sp. BE223]|uniref:HIRAN domain-containing protein n=1 Tax=Croceicoccus sp. BE223 TaxID=2817716 RepID=UPI0028592885|nr:HIRAN domain-containing protein [Croceicoccus sp. BE223]MDR7101491.1 hypothetical protein [Croceicoccus sp. BE223]
MCAPGEPVELRPEPNNPADPRAVAVFSARGIQLGYLTAERCRRIGSLIRAGTPIHAIYQGAGPSCAWIRASFDGTIPEIPRQPSEAPTTPDFWPDEEYD